MGVGVCTGDDFVDGDDVATKVFEVGVVGVAASIIKSTSCLGVV